MCKEYLEFAEGNKKSWERDAQHLANLKAFIGNVKISEISPFLLEKYKIERRKHVAPATVNRELSCLRRVFNLAITWDKAKKNPVSGVKFFRENPPKEFVLTEEQEKKLLDACPPYLRDIITIALNTGMRRGEILGLTWNDVDLEAGFIHVRQSKSGKDRKIPINDTLKGVLMNLKEKSQNFVSESVSSKTTPLPYLPENTNEMSPGHRSFKPATRVQIPSGTL